MGPKLRSKLTAARSRIGIAWGILRSWIIHVKVKVRCWHAMLWQLLYRTRYRLSLLKARYGGVATTSLMILLVVCSSYLAPTFQEALEPHFKTEERFAGFRALLLTLGGALIGATAIAFSLVMFAMQVNVERMPHGLFRRFSSDPKLLGSFSATFLLAITVATLSLIPDRSRLALAVLIAGWATVMILLLFLYAYRRALSLISPAQQLALVLEDAHRDLEAWGRRARRATPLFERSEHRNDDDKAKPASTHDLSRVAYFQINPHWTALAHQAVLHCMSFARRYAEHGDHEVSRAALTAVVAIHNAYVAAKGKTFFANVLLFENPLSRDGFITETLEHLRRNVQIGISRGDEQQIEQTFGAMAALCQIYLNIDYSTEHASKTHAHLAAGYLSNSVQSVLPRNMPDVVMEGIRLMGETAQLMISYAEPNDIVPTTERIALIASAGIVKEDYRPVTQIGMQQLARLTFELIRSKCFDIRYSVKKIRDDVSMVVKLFLNIPDTPLSSIHSSCLGPYYSSTNVDTLLGWLTELVNALVGTKADDKAAKGVIRHIEQWADRLYQTEKEIFLAAIEKRSPFTFDIVHWIAHITKLFLAVSNVAACDEYTRDELRKSALWLISVLSWVPDEKEAIGFVENYGMTETLFEVAIDAHNRGCDEVVVKVRDLLFSWAFKAGKHETGWGILERACCGLATLDLMRKQDGSWLTAAISERLAKGSAPDQALRDRAAREIRERAATLHHEQYSLSRIEYAMRHTDQDKLRSLLGEIANRLSPGTADEPVQTRPFY
jgi:hypothetical protein